MEPQNKDKITFSMNKRHVMTVLLVIVGVLLGMLIMLMYGSVRPSESTASSIPTSDIPPMPGTPAVPAVTVDSADSSMKIFTAPDLGIAFHYLANVYHEGEDYMGPDNTQFVDDPTLSGTRISYKDGFLEVFNKTPEQNLVAAVQSTFLIDSSNTQCSVHAISPNDDSAFYGALSGITFVRIDAHGADANCPVPYSSDNTSASFFMFPAHPEKFFFVMSTTNSEPTLRLKNGDPFFASIEFLK